MPPGEPEDPFPDPETFADRVIELSDDVFAELGVAELDLHIDYAIPPVDERRAAPRSYRPPPEEEEFQVEAGLRRSG